MQKRAVLILCSFVLGLPIPGFSGESSTAVSIEAGSSPHPIPRQSLVPPTNPSVADIERLRVFSEPLIPIGSVPSSEQNQAIGKALQQYCDRTEVDDFSALELFVARHPKSPWTPSVMFNLATEYYNTGWYSKSLATWEQVWPILKPATELKAKALADRAAGELAFMYARLGRTADLSALLDSVKDRVFVGSATERIAGAKQGLWTMLNRPGIAYKCGPYALGCILGYEHPGVPANPLIESAQSSTNGCPLTQVAALSQQVGLDFQMAYRNPGAPLILPAVVNWKLGHYAALLKEENGRYLLKDPTFGNETWVSKRVLEAEASGYFLVPSGHLPSGWRSVSTAEGETVFGKGTTATSDQNSNSSLDPQTNCGSKGGAGSIQGEFGSASQGGFGSGIQISGSPGGSNIGMPRANAHLMLVSLSIQDTPLSYNTPVGPPVRFIVTYSQREANQPAVFSYSNLGPKWTFNWLAYITDNPNNPSADVNYYMDGGGTLPFTGFDTNSQSFAVQPKGHVVLKRTSTNSYEMTFLTGAKMIFDQPDSVGGSSRRVFMTEVVDPAGNTVHISYDGSFRVTGVTDAIGQVTTLSYDDISDPLKITKVTDPFGRFATFTYDASNRLASIKDQIGLTSQFQYNAGDFIQAMITPYGTNTFEEGESGRTRWLVRTYPDGGKERVEYNENTTTGIPSSEPAAAVPAGMTVANVYLVYRNTFFWDRKEYAEGAGDYRKAHIYHWLHVGGNCSGILESEKQPLENRIWRNYDGQPAAYQVGTNDSPNAIGRVLDDGTTQLVRYHYDAFGNVTNTVDPLGRSTTYIYSTNHVDLLEVRQTTGSNNDLLARYLYNSQHRPVAVYDAAGQLTTNTYNARGQLLATTDPKNETTTLTYDTSGYLLSINGPLPGNSDSISFTYDSAARIRTTTDMDGYTTTNSYDNLDRLTNAAYPDGTFAAVAYDRLDPVMIQDRLGRQTHLAYDNLERLVSVEDPLNRSLHYGYCNCGDLETLIDPMGRPTTWNYDLEGRMTSKQYSDGSQIIYTYENTTSRLKSVQDEKGQIRSFEYNLDNDIHRISYPKVQVPTHAVSFAYDPNYNRLTSIQDGIGTTAYNYNPAGSLGALQIASVSGPWTDETISYQYDVLGQMTNRIVNGVAQAYAYDEMGRVTNVVNALGSFAYGYDGPTTRPLDSLYPNGQTTHYDYFNNLGDHRLQRITNFKPDTSIISRFTYGYNVVGEITNWLQELGPATNDWSITYDNADQLLAVQDDASLTNLDYAYGYDPSGNRLFETGGSTNRTFQYNALNQLSSSSDSTLTNVAYEWDAEQRLVAINTGDNRTEFSYDGLGRCRRILELTNNVPYAERRYVWDGLELCEERDGNDAVLRRFYDQGFTANGADYFYTRDHLGSVREVTDGSGSVVSRYAYDPYGRQTILQNGIASPLGFAGMFDPLQNGLLFTLLRPYDSNAGRWLSRDPYGEEGGMNLYGYVFNDPVNFIDPYGNCGRPWGNLWGAAKNSAAGLGYLGLLWGEGTARAAYYGIKGYEFIEFWKPGGGLDKGIQELRNFGTGVKSFIHFFGERNTDMFAKWEMKRLWNSAKTWMVDKAKEKAKDKIIEAIEDPLAEHADEIMQATANRSVGNFRAAGHQLSDLFKTPSNCDCQ